MARDYNITRPSGQCTTCHRPMQPGEEFIATIRQAGEEFARADYCPGCWDGCPQKGLDDPQVLGVWRTRLPEPKERRKLFLDDDVLVSFFQRLEGAAEPVKVQFRFVLALILMRKKLLVYDRSERTPDGGEVWTVHLKGTDAPCRVVDPQMDDENIAEVSQQLGQILEAEL